MNPQTAEPASATSFATPWGALDLTRFPADPRERLRAWDAADEYLLLADFESYRDAHVRAGQAYQDPKRWNKMSLMNIARSGIFAADRSIRDYAKDIWNVPVREIK